MATPRDIINKSLKLIGVLAQGESGTADQLADGLESLNDMLESWSTENLIIHKEVTEDFSLVAAQQTYTMGTGGDFNTTRPVEIINMTWQDDSVSPVLELPIEVITQKIWKYTQLKGTSSNIITHAYVNYGDSLVTLKFWPVPSAARKVSITAQKVLTTYTSLSTAIALPPGYLRALKYNLALEVAPEYGVDASPRVDRIASLAKSNIKRQNIKPRTVGSEIARLQSKGAFDYRTGE